MTERMRGWMHRLFGNTDRKLRLLLLLGLAGVVLIAVSELLPARRDRQEAERSVPADSGTLPAAAVEAALEERIAALLHTVDGVGSCRVMVTLERGVQLVYAADQTSSAGQSGTAGSEKTLTVSTDSGPVGLLITELQPAVRGVVVVCAGGGDPAVCEQVTQLVATAFNISARRVCVAKGQ